MQSHARVKGEVLSLYTVRAEGSDDSLPGALPCFGSSQENRMPQALRLGHAPDLTSASATLTFSCCNPWGD
jgi:hypothetical protein